MCPEKDSSRWIQRIWKSSDHRLHPPATPPLQPAASPDYNPIPSAEFKVWCVKVYGDHCFGLAFCISKPDQTKIGSPMLSAT
jgi:hypothetical protein